MLKAESVNTAHLARTYLYAAKVRIIAAHGRCSGIPHGYAAGATAYSQTKQHSGKERLLRYPDGRVRCIRYPEISAEVERLAEQLDPTVSYEEDWDPDRWDDIDWAWDVLGSQDSASAGAMNPPLSRPLPQTSDSPQKVSMPCPANQLIAYSLRCTNFLSVLSCRPDIHSPVLQICCEP